MNREQELAYGRAYRLKNKERIREADKRYRDTVRKQHRRDERLRVIKHYSGQIPKCACCKETELVFLVLDHLNNDGNAHRRKSGIASGRGTIEWIIKNDFPAMFQVLCQNCNLAKAILGSCPHSIKSH